MTEIHYMRMSQWTPLWTVLRTSNCSERVFYNHTWESSAHFYVQCMFLNTSWNIIKGDLHLFIEQLGLESYQTLWSSFTRENRNFIVLRWNTVQESFALNGPHAGVPVWGWLLHCPVTVVWRDGSLGTWNLGNEVQCLSRHRRKEVDALCSRFHPRLAGESLGIEDNLSFRNV